VFYSQSPHKSADVVERALKAFRQKKEAFLLQQQRQQLQDRDLNKEHYQGGQYPGSSGSGDGEVKGSPGLRISTGGAASVAGLRSIGDASTIVYPRSTSPLAQPSATPETICTSLEGYLSSKRSEGERQMAIEDLTKEHPWEQTLQLHEIAAARRAHRETREQSARHGIVPTSSIAEIEARAKSPSMRRCK
jgi:hypothetical protein